MIWELAQPAEQYVRVDKVFEYEDPDEALVLVTKGNELAHRKVVRLYTQSGEIASVVIANCNCPFLPTLGQNSSVNRHSVHVEPKRLVKLRELPKCAVNGIDHVDCGDWRDVGLSRLS